MEIHEIKQKFQSSAEFRLLSWNHESEIKIDFFKSKIEIHEIQPKFPLSAEFWILRWNHESEFRNQFSI